MKHNEWENDGFDELLRDALASDAAPSGDFTERLMEQVRRTPQEKAKNRPYKKILAAVAACAVIAVAIPLVMPRGNSTASADNAAPMMDMTADDGAYDNEYMTSGAPSGDREPADSQQKVTEDAKNGADDLPLIDADQEITLVGQDAADAKAALDEMGIQPTAAENSSYTYVLTEQQAQELGKTVDALYNIEGSLALVLEVTE
jgi:negative regulator of sigma E activity